MQYVRDEDHVVAATVLVCPVPLRPHRGTWDHAQLSRSAGCVQMTLAPQRITGWESHKPTRTRGKVQTSMEIGDNTGIVDGDIHVWKVPCSPGAACHMGSPHHSDSPRFKLSPVLGLGPQSERGGSARPPN